MVDYVSLAATAERLIAENGRDVTLVKRSETPADAGKPWRGTTADDTSITVKGVVIPFEAEDQDGDLFRREDKQAFVAADATSPNEIESFDELDDGSDTYKIINVELIHPGDTRVLYVLQVRK